LDHLAAPTVSEYVISLRQRSQYDTVSVLDRWTVNCADNIYAEALRQLYDLTLVSDSGTTPLWMLTPDALDNGSPYCDGVLSQLCKEWAGSIEKLLLASGALRVVNIPQSGM
jgi:hypothetical protein